MRQLKVATERKTQLLDVADRVHAALEGDGGSLVTLFVPHTTAGIVVQAPGPVADGRLALGGHQAIFLAEFGGPRERTLILTVTR